MLHGGAVEVWQTDLPYLQSVDSPEDDSLVPNYYSVVTFTTQEFRDRFLAAYPAAKLDGDAGGFLTDITRNDAGFVSTLRVGGKLGNLGGYLGKTDYTLPMDLTAGVALDTFLSDAHEITVGADWGYYFSPARVRGFQMSVGAEYNLMQLIQLRAGYHYGERRNYYPTYGSVGAGVRFLHLRLDFAYLIARKETLLHNTYSISFGFDF